MHTKILFSIYNNVIYQITFILIYCYKPSPNQLYLIFRIMDAIDESKSFIKHVFNTENESKIEILNIIQYAMLALIPIVILNKTMQKYVPAADEQKSTTEILAEIVAQTCCMFIGLVIVHRIITYIPTYSNEDYAEYNILFSILPTLMITLSLQTKLGEKVSILVERANDMWNGTEKTTVMAKNSRGVTVTQPISGQNNSQPMHESFTDGTAIGALPVSMPQHQPQQQMQQQQPQMPQQMQPQQQQQSQQQQGVEFEAAGDFGGFGGFGNW
jgi:hypothetical protein